MKVLLPVVLTFAVACVSPDEDTPVEGPSDFVSIDKESAPVNFHDIDVGEQAPVKVHDVVGVWKPRKDDYLDTCGEGKTRGCPPVNSAQVQSITVTPEWKTTVEFLAEDGTPILIEGSIKTARLPAGQRGLYDLFEVTVDKRIPPASLGSIERFFLSVHRHYSSADDTTTAHLALSLRSSQVTVEESLDKEG